MPAARLVQPGLTWHSSKIPGSGDFVFAVTHARMGGFKKSAGLLAGALDDVKKQEKEGGKEEEARLACRRAR